MATKAALKAKNAYVQYSKKMCTAVAIFWMLYRLLISILIFFNPSVSSAFITLSEGADTVMIVNISVYSGNSISEKVATAWVKRGQKNDDEEEKEDNTEE